MTRYDVTTDLELGFRVAGEQWAEDTTETGRLRYVGGTRNGDGAITRTVGINADTPEQARARIAERLTRLNRRFGSPETVTADMVGLVRAQPADTPRQGIGGEK